LARLVSVVTRKATEETMSAEIINLSKARKAREKEKTARTSAENRV